MATDTAPASAAPPGPAARPARRHLWQLPTFALGVAACVAAYAAFPPAPADPAAGAANDLAALRQAVGHRAGDPAAVEPLIRAAVARAGEFPDLAPAARFLAGSGYLALADANPADPDLWARAATLLADVDPARLPDPADPARLVYRRALAAAALGTGDPDEVVKVLAVPPPGEPLDGERPRLLADACLRADPPKLKAAKEALTAYVTGPGRAPAAILARAKLALGDVYQRLDDPAGARKWLGEAAAGPDAPADARARLVKLAAAENDWAEAARQADAALAGPGLPADQRALVRYQAGVAHTRLKDQAKAADHFEDAAKDPGPVGAAAAVRLAELVLRDPAKKGARARAVELLEAAARPAAGDNPYVPAADVRGAFEEAVGVCLAEGEFPAAVRAAAAYGAVAEPGRDKEKKADALAAWAGALKEAKAPDAPAKFKEAADEFQALAAARPTPAGKADALRRAVDALRQAGDAPAALAAVDQLARVPGLRPEDAGAAWLDRGDLLLAGGRVPEAVDALGQAVLAPGPAAGVARVKLALAHLDQATAKAKAGGPQAEVDGQVDHAQNLLAQAANAPAATPAERDAQQQGLFALGKLLLLRKSFPDAEARLRQLVQAYPAAPTAPAAKFYLGCALTALARTGPEPDRPPVDADKKLAEAADLFRAAGEAADPYVRAQADVRLAYATWQLKRFDEMPDLCDRLAARNKGRVEELVILSALCSAYDFSDRPDKQAKVELTRARLREAYDALPDAAFTGPEEMYTRAYWQTRWFPQAAGPK